MVAHRTEGLCCILDAIKAAAYLAFHLAFNFNFRIFEWLKTLVNFYFSGMHSSSLWRVPGSSFLASLKERVLTPPWH